MDVVLSPQLNCKVCSSPLTDGSSALDMHSRDGGDQWGFCFGQKFKKIISFSSCYLYAFSLGGRRSSCEETRPSSPPRSFCYLLLFFFLLLFFQGFFFSFFFFISFRFLFFFLLHAQFCWPLDCEPLSRLSDA